MPNRIIRETILDSERYWSVSDGARLLFIHLMLLADDFACVSLAPIQVRRRCFSDAPSQEKIDGLLAELESADLIRGYESGGAKYAFIPRFRQRLQRVHTKHPKPPESVINGDEHAQEMFRKINDKTEKSTVGKQLDNGDPSPEGKGREGKGRKSLSSARPSGPASDDPVFAESWAAYPRRKGTNSRSDALKAFTARANEGISPEEMLAGVRRYAEFCRTERLEGTEFVMQASRFFGPGRHFSEPWLSSTQGQATTIARTGKAAL